VNPFSAIFVPDALADAVSDRAWVRAMLAAERALALAQLDVAPEAVTAVVAACEADDYDAAVLAEEARTSGTPVTPLVNAIRARVPDEYAGAVHRGATSQDIVDTAAMLVSRDAVALILADLDRAAGACARLAEEHRGTVMAARTLLQQAVPTTFGAKSAAWLAGVLDARYFLARWRPWAQLGGAAGTLAAFGPHGADVLQRFAEELGLGSPDMPWHGIRTPFAELAGVLATSAGIAAKIGGDIVLLAQTEVGEVAEAAPGGSSTMPHKANPVSAVVAVACERHARANCGVLLESLVVEHERPAGAWHTEWHALTTALAATGGAAAAVARSLEGLKVDVARMRANIVPATLSEAERFGLHPAGPEEYLGSVDVFIDRVLARYRG
jgi:3-carboxy-cis,cis-muconate cycloisomerase